LAFTWFDLLVVVAYLIGITAFGARFRRKQRTLRDYFLGDRRLPWWAVSLSVVSAETSILTLIGTPGLAFASNMNFLQLALGYIVGKIAIAIILIPRYFRGELFTAYQLIEQRFGKRLKIFTAVLFLVMRALAEGVRVLAIAFVFEAIFKTGVLASVLVVTLLTLLYTYEGGLTAVIWTDVIQLTIYLSGTMLALWVALHAIPGGWPEVERLASICGDKLSIFNFRFDSHEPYLFWAGLLGGAFLTSASSGTDQLFVQRLLAARNRKESQAALLASGVIVFFQFGLFLVVGVVLFAFYHFRPPGIPFERGDQVFPTFVVRELPPGLAGLVTAAIVAAGMANLSAALNALASSSVVDFYRPYMRPGRDERHYLRVSRGLTLIWGGALIVIAFLFRAITRSVLELALTVASVPYGSMLGIFLLGALTKRATEKAVFVAALVGLAALSAVIAFTSIAWTWYVAIGTTVTFACGWGFSRMARSQPLPHDAGRFPAERFAN